MKKKIATNKDSEGGLMNYCYCIVNNENEDQNLKTFETNTRVERFEGHEQVGLSQIYSL